jgi:hypothetical protein
MCVANVVQAFYQVGLFFACMKYFLINGRISSMQYLFPIRLQTVAVGVLQSLHSDIFVCSSYDKSPQARGSPFFSMTHISTEMCISQLRQQSTMWLPFLTRTPLMLKLMGFQLSICSFSSCSYLNTEASACS